MEDLETSKIDAETDDFSLIDVSASDDDFLVASNSDPNMMDDQGHFVKGVPSTQPSDSLALHKAKPSKCNLRKSLAWDSAFFTNAGVLDAEELSSIIEGTETSAKQNLFLPGIEEELSKSTDSISTFQSDNATLESLEADLFSDIRASIQRSSKSSTMRNGSVSEISGEEGSNNGCSKKIVGPCSRKMAKPTSVSSKLNSGVQGSVRSSKPISVSKQVMKPPVNRSREPSSILPRLPKAAAGPSLQAATTTKRMSVDAGRVKLDAKATGSVKGKGASSSVVSHQVDSRKPLPKTPAVSKLSTASSVTRKPIPRAPAVSKASAYSSVMNNRTSSHSSHSSCDSLSNSASENVRKSQTGVNRRTKDKNVNLPSGSKIRTLSKVVEKVKFQKNESCLSAYLKSTSNLSPNISPASSISEWSTESSSSTATINQKHFGLNQCSASPQNGTVDGNASQNLHNLARNQVPGTCGQSSKQTSTGSAVSGTRTGSAKPSGLRMPSPNIGFFDGAKAGSKTPSSSSRSRSALPSTLPRSVAGSSSPSGAINKTKLGTSASKMTAATVGTVRPQQRVTDANLKTAGHLLDHSNDKPEMSSAVKHVDKGPEMSSKFSISDPPKAALESNDNAPKGPDVAKYVLDSQLVGEDNLASDHVSGGISSDFLKSISPKSTLERNNEISGVSSDSSPRKNVPGLWLKNDREGLQNISSATSELPKGNLSLPALEVSEVAFITVGGKQVLELASVTKDNLAHSLLGTVHLGKVNDCSEDPSEPSKSTSVDSALEENSEVVDREIHALSDFDSVAKDNLIAPEGIEHVASDLANAASEDGFSVLDTTNVVSPHSYTEHSSNSSIVYHNRSLSQHIGETINREVGSQHKQQDEGGSVEHGATDEDQCSAIFYNNFSPSQHNDETRDHEVIRQHKHDEGGSVEHCATDENQCSGIAYNNLSPFQYIDETDNLEVISQYKQQDEGGRVEHGATKENRCSEIFCINLSPSQHIDEIDTLEATSQQNQQHEGGSLEYDTPEAISQQNQQHEGGSLEYDTTNEDRCTEIGYNNLSSSQHIDDETDNLEIVSQHNEDESVGHGANDGNHCSRNGLAEIKESKVKEFITNVGAADKFDIQDESDRNVQSEYAQFSSLITCSPTSPTGDGSVGRTPFTIKNTVSNVVEVSKFPTGSATEAFLKVDDAVVVLSLEKFQKENS